MIFSKKCGLISKSADLGFLHTVQRFGLISKVFGASKTWKKQQNRCLGNHGFLREQKSAPESGFSSFFMIFGFHFGAPGRQKIEKIKLSLCFSVRRALWIVLGPLGAPFWRHFGVILSSFLTIFRRFSVRCPILFEKCSWCWVFPLAGFVFSVFYYRKR